MISRNEFLYNQSRLQKLENALFEFECVNPVYLAWKKWQGMSVSQRDDITRKWDKYFKDVLETESYSEFVEAREALSKGRIADVKALALKAKQRNERGVFLPRPTTIDPETFDRLLQPYFKAKASINAIKSVIEEYMPVYGRKGGISDGLDM